MNEYRIGPIEELDQAAMTPHIQEAIDQCSEAGGGKVVLTAGVYVTGTLCLKDRVTLRLEQGALLLGSDRIEDYPDNETCFEDAVGHKRGKALLYACGASDIGIEGEGVIDGRGGLFPPDHPAHLIRPFLVRLVNCRGIRVREITLRQSAAWCLHIQDSEAVQVERVRILNRCNGNNDGIDIDGCSNVQIRNCWIDSGDDALCMKSTSEHPCRDIRISGCQVSSRWAAFKIGTESVGDFENIEVSDCLFCDVKGCGVKIVPTDGGNVRNLCIHDVRMIRCTGPVFISTGKRLRRYFQASREVPGAVENLRLERITADVVSAAGEMLDGKPWGNAKGCVVLSGQEGEPIRNVVLRDCCFTMPGGVREQPLVTVPEMGTQYPEFHLFDVLPAWGLYLRHVDGVTLSNVVMTKKEADVRPVTVLEDAVRVTADGNGL